MSQPPSDAANAVTDALAAFEVGEPTLTLHADMPPPADSTASAASDDEDPIDLAALTASTYAALAESARLAMANSSCPCEPWVAARARNACADMRACKYVRNTQAIRALRERAERTLFYSYLEPLQSTATAASTAAASPSTVAAAAAAVASATSSPAASSSSAVPSPIRSFSLSIPQCPVLMHSGAGWASTGGGDATGYVLWPAAMFATRLLHSTRVIERERRAQGQQPRPCLDDTPFVSLELGCGAALVSQYLSLIVPQSPPRCCNAPSAADPAAAAASAAVAATVSAASAAAENVVYATDQNTAVWNDLKDRIRVRLHSKPCPSGEAADDVPAALLDPAPGSEEAAAALQACLQRVQILPYEWGEPLHSTLALSPLRAPHRTPSLLVGCDLVYFSIAYPKLLSSIWELFENHVFEQSAGHIAVRGWMEKQPRGPSATAAAAAVASSSSSAASAASVTSPLLFLCHKSRHAETEQDLLIALSSFACVYQMRPEFVAQLQKQGRTAAGATVASASASAAPASDGEAAFSSASSPMHFSPSSSLPSWPLDPLPLDCTDPFLRFFFAMPRCTALAAQATEAALADEPASAAAAQFPSACTDAASAPVSSSPSLDDETSGECSAWSAHLRACHRSFEAAPTLESWSAHSPLAPHWLLCHFGDMALQPWVPDPAFTHDS